MKTKILVGCPTCDIYEYCLDAYLNAAKNLSHDNYDILLVDNSKTEDYMNKLKKLGINVIKDSYKEDARDRIVSSRNILRQYALDNGYDYLLSLEQDVIPPRDIIEKLLSYNKEIMSAVYFNYIKWNEEDMLVPLLLISKDTGYFKARYMQINELKPRRLVQVKACGLGCVLIHRDVLEKINFRYEKDKKGFDDVWFGVDTQKAEFKIFTDTGIICKHLIDNKPWQWKVSK